MLRNVVTNWHGTKCIMHVVPWRKIDLKKSYTFPFRESPVFYLLMFPVKALLSLSHPPTLSTES